MPVRAYDAGYLREAVDSMHAQTDPAWRLVVIAEPDGMAQLAAELEGDLADPRIELLANEGRKLAGAFNTGMRRCRTPFAAILLADDLWAPRAVSVLGEQIREHPGVDFFHTSRIIIDDDGNHISSVYPVEPEIHPEDFLRRGPAKHLLCWRVDMALALGGMDESLNSVGPDDWDFPWTMAEHGAVFRALEEPLYFYRDHRRCFRLTTHVPRGVHAREIRRIMRKHGASRRQIRRRLSHDRAKHLRQCLYDSRLEQWVRRVTGSEPRSGWRETYR